MTDKSGPLPGEHTIQRSEYRYCSSCTQIQKESQALSGIEFKIHAQLNFLILRLHVNYVMD